MEYGLASSAPYGLRRGSVHFPSGFGNYLLLKAYKKKAQGIEIELGVQGLGFGCLRLLFKTLKACYKNKRQHFWDLGSQIGSIGILSIVYSYKYE